MLLSQDWSPTFLLTLADEYKASARNNVGKNWVYSACRDLAAADALEYLAERMVAGQEAFQFDVGRLKKITD